MAKTIKNRIKRQRSLKQFRDFKPIAEYFDKTSPEIKKLPRFRKVKEDGK